MRPVEYLLPFTSGLDTRFPAEALRTYQNYLVHQQPGGEAFHESHQVEQFRFVPLTNRCNATYCLVPVWVNPAIVVFGVLLLVSVVGCSVDLVTTRRPVPGTRLVDRRAGRT